MERQTEKRNFDEFGFVILPQMQEYENERSHEYTAKKKFWKIELTAWDKLLKTWNVSRLRGSSKVTKFVQHGVPIQIRGELWKKLLDIEVIKATVKCTYKEELCQIREQLVDLGISEYGGQKVLDEISEVESESYRVKYKHISLDALRHIFLDLHRSLPTHELFMGETAKAKEGRAALFRVLAAYARYNRSVEYCQGMSVIAAMFLIQTNCDEETAFWCLVSLLDRHKYILGYFHNNMARLQEHADVFSRLLQQRHPEIQIHLAKYEIHPLMYITPWFMVLFTGFACWDTVLACWDLLLLQGHSALFRISLAVMEVNKANILAAKDLCHLLPLLLHPPVSVCRHDVLMSAVYSTHIEDWEISSLQAVLDEEKNKIPDLEHLEKEEMQPETEKSEKPEIGNSAMRKIISALKSSDKPTNLDRKRRSSTRLRSQKRTSKENARTPRSTMLRGVQKNSPARQGRIQKRRSLKNSQLAISPCQEALEYLSIRRSPRLAPGRALRVVNDSLQDRLCLKEASEKHAFHAFHTPKPLSKHHHCVNTPPFLASPDVEMREMKMKLEIMH